MKDKRVKIAVILLLCIFIITISVTVAFFNYMKKGTTENVLKTSTIMLHYDETNKMGQGISITDALPASSNESEKTNDHYFEFNISGVSNKEDISYLVTARKSSNSSDIDSDIDIYLTDEYDNPLFGGIHKYSELVQYRENTNYTEKVIYTDTMEGNGVELNKNFRLRMWIDEKTDFSDGAYNDKTFKVTVNVYTADISDYTPIPVSGFYDLNGTQIYTWQELLDNNYFTMSNGVVDRGTAVNSLFNMDGSIVVDKSVTELGNGVFAGSTKLKTITIPNTVTTISYSAFASSKVESIIFEKNSNLQTILNGSFSSVTELKSLEIPANVTSIASGAFAGSGIETITFANNPKITNLNNVFAHMKYLKNITIPKNVTQMDGAFYNSSLESIAFEEGSKLERIGESTFKSCTNLKSIEIPSSVITIESEAFADSGLETITFAANSNLTTINGSVFSGAGLKNIVLPSSITTIAAGAFNGSGIEKITFEENSSLEELISGSLAVPTLEEIVLPSSLKTIRSYAFNGANNLTSVTFTNPNGWSISGISIDSSDLSNPTTAATYVKSTYLNSTWTRTN